MLTRDKTNMRRTILLTGVLPFLSAFFGAVLAFSLVVPPPATAQPGGLQEVRGSAFVLVDQNGAILARLAPAPSGDALMSFRDAAGTTRLRLHGAGSFTVFGPDSSTAFRAGNTFGDAMLGDQSVNGVLLGPGGSIGMLPSAP